jgi:hypothetical protein
MEQPVYYWDPVIAPSGMAIYDGAMFPEWKGSVFVGGLIGMKVVRLQMKGDKVAGEEWLLPDLRQRVRDVQQGNDGALYVVTDKASCCASIARRRSGDSYEGQNHAQDVAWHCDRALVRLCDDKPGRAVQRYNRCCAADRNGGNCRASPTAG